MHASLIIFSACVLVACAFPESYIPIIAKSEIHHPDGAFQVNYQTGDGQAFSENAQAKPNNDNTGTILVRSGHYAYTAPDGTPISLSYVADENGFRVNGAHIPKAPAAQF